MKQINSILKFTLKNHNYLPKVLETLNGNAFDNKKSSVVEYETSKYSMECTSNVGDNNLIDINEKLSKHCDYVKLIPKFYQIDKNIRMPWFPQSIVELYTFCNVILGCSDELDILHPGANDQEYINRRCFSICIFIMLLLIINLTTKLHAFSIFTESLSLTKHCFINHIRHCQTLTTLKKK